MENLIKHQQQVLVYSELLGDSYGLDKKDLKLLRFAAKYHDIGKLWIDQGLFRLERKLTQAEFNIIKLHPVIGAKYIKHLLPDIKILQGIRHHHEWWNGTGYPNKYEGGFIPLFARIISITDAYDAIISGRPYQKPKGHLQAIKELQRCSGIQFDPYLVKLFVELIGVSKI